MLWFKDKFPDIEWLNKANDVPPTTPDLHLLDRTAGQWLFEYGDIRHRGLIKKHLALPVYTVDKFSVFKSREYTYHNPVALNTRICTTAERARIKGLLYFVKPDQYIDLDIQRQNGVHFERKRIKLIIPLLETEAPHALEAWTYIGKKEFWDPQLEWDYGFYRSLRNQDCRNLLPVKTIKDNRSWLNTYYDFSQDYTLPKQNVKCFLHIGRNLVDPTPAPEPIKNKPEVNVIIKDNRAA